MPHAVALFFLGDVHVIVSVTWQQFNMRIKKGNDWLKDLKALTFWEYPERKGNN